MQEAELRDEIERLRGSEQSLRDNLSRLRSSEQDLADQALNLELDKEQLERRLAELAAAAAAARTNLLQSEADLEQERALSVAAREQATVLNRQLADVRARLDELGRLLDAAEADREAKEIQIVELGERLNAALATRVSDLALRSEFFGGDSRHLRNRAYVRIVGDRLHLPVRSAFASGWRDSPNRRRESPRSPCPAGPRGGDPGGRAWILQIEGTPTRTRSSRTVPSNWELSSGKATR